MLEVLHVQTEMYRLSHYDEEQLKELRNTLMPGYGEGRDISSSLGVVPSLGWSVIQDFDILALLHRSEDPRLEAFISYLRLKYENMNLLPAEQHFIRYNMGLYTPSGPHIAIVNCNSLQVTPSEVQSGVGAGSEEALVELSKRLAQNGFRVTIFAEVDSSSGLTLGSANPRYYPRDGIRMMEDEDFDLCLAWRRTDWWRLKQYLRCPIIFCPHDWASDKELDTDGLDGTSFLTSYQAEEYFKYTPALRSLPWSVVGNGYDPSHFSAPHPVREQLLCCYYSAYHRGLEGVLDAWPLVKEKHPEARLEIYYGRENWGLLTDESLKKITTKIEALKGHGVIERGRIPHRELAREMLRASLFINASKFKETYGIVHVKSLAAGVVLVGTDVVDRSLVPQEIELLDHTSPSLVSDLARQVISRLNQAIGGELEPLRERCRKHVENFTWKHSCERLVQFIAKEWKVEREHEGKER